MQTWVFCLHDQHSVFQDCCWYFASISSCNLTSWYLIDCIWLSQCCISSLSSASDGSFSSTTFSKLFLITHFANATALSFFDVTVILIEPSMLVKILCSFFHLLAYLIDVGASTASVFLVSVLLCATSAKPKYWPKSALLNMIWFSPSKNFNWSCSYVMK